MINEFKTLVMWKKVSLKKDIHDMFCKTFGLYHHPSLYSEHVDADICSQGVNLP